MFYFSVCLPQRPTSFNFKYTTPTSDVICYSEEVKISSIPSTGFTTTPDTPKKRPCKELKSNTKFQDDAVCLSIEAYCEYY